MTQSQLYTQIDSTIKVNSAATDTSKTQGTPHRVLLKDLVDFVLDQAAIVADIANTGDVNLRTYIDTNTVQDIQFSISGNVLTLAFYTYQNQLMNSIEVQLTGDNVVLAGYVSPNTLFNAISDKDTVTQAFEKSEQNFVAAYSYADNAMSAANAAQNTADNAQTTANDAQNAANSAVELGSATNTTANTANSTANTANSTANAANNAASTALNTANAAQTTANTANATANSHSAKIGNNPLITASTNLSDAVNELKTITNANAANISTNTTNITNNTNNKQDKALTGYAIATVTPSAISTTDTVVIGLGKLEKKANDAQSTANTANATANTANNNVTNKQDKALTGYQIASGTQPAISTTDTVVIGLGKLEKKANDALPQTGGAVGNINVTNSVTITSSANAAKNATLAVYGSTNSLMFVTCDQFIFQASGSTFFNMYTLNGGGAEFYFPITMGNIPAFNTAWAAATATSPMLVPRYKLEEVTNNLYTVSSTIQTAVTGGTFTNGELNGTQPTGSLLGQKFVNATHRFEFMPNAAGTVNVWVRTAKV